MTYDEMLVGVIVAIAADDKNYPSAALKLGGIWGICDEAYLYRRRKNIEGGEVIEVLPKFVSEGAGSDGRNLLTSDSRESPAVGRCQPPVSEREEEV